MGTEFITPSPCIHKLFYCVIAWGTLGGCFKSGLPSKPHKNILGSTEIFQLFVYPPLLILNFSLNAKCLVPSLYTTVIIGCFLPLSIVLAWVHHRQFLSHHDAVSPVRSNILPLDGLC